MVIKGTFQDREIVKERSVLCILNSGSITIFITVNSVVYFDKGFDEIVHNVLLLIIIIKHSEYKGKPVSTPSTCFHLVPKKILN